MEKWTKSTYLVAVYIFLTELRPLEPYMTAYLTGPDVNVSLSEVANVMESIKSYSALFVAIIMLTSADYLLYKPNIIILTAWTCLSYVLMIGSPGLTRLRIAMVGNGAMYTSCIMAFSYMFAQIEDEKHFQAATAITTVATQLGKVTGDFLAQIIVNATEGNYAVLVYCNVLGTFLAVVCVCLFPSLKRKQYFVEGNVIGEKSLLIKHDMENTVKYCEEKNGRSFTDNKNYTVVIVLKEIWINFKISYSNLIVLKRSLWYIMGVSLFLQILTNMNVLYSYVVNEPDNHDVLSENGLAEAMVTLSGAAGAYLFGKVRLDWTYYGDVFTAFCSTTAGILMMSCYFHKKLFYIYLSYILFSFVGQSHAVIVFSEIAKQLKKQWYSVVLVFNYFAALTMVSIMTLFLIQFNFFGITVPGRFLFFGGLYVVLGIIFFFISIFTMSGKKYKSLDCL